MSPSPHPLPGQSSALPSVAPALNSPLSRSRRRRAPRFPLLSSDIRQSSWWGTGHRWGLECLSPRPSASAEQPWPAVVSRPNLYPETFSYPAPPKPGKGGRIRKWKPSFVTAECQEWKERGGWLAIALQRLVDVIDYLDDINSSTRKLRHQRVVFLLW